MTLHLESVMATTFYKAGSPRPPPPPRVQNSAGPKDRTNTENSMIAHRAAKYVNV